MPVQNILRGLYKSDTEFFAINFILVKCVLYISWESSLNEALKYTPLIYAILHRSSFLLPACEYLSQTTRYIFDIVYPPRTTSLVAIPTVF